MRDCDESREVVDELERLGASPEVVLFVLRDVIGYEVTRGAAVQRVRRAKEKRLRVAQQEREKAALLASCLAAYRKQCAYCEGEGTAELGPDGFAWELDRIFPGCRGGEYVAGNVCLSCRRCNRKKLANVTFRPPPALADITGGIGA